MRLIDCRAKCVLLLAGLLATILWALSALGLGSFTEEGQFVENTSSFLLGFTAIVAGLQLARFRSRLWLSGFLVVLWMYMRELDYQRLFTPRSIESLGYFFSPAISMTPKLIVLAALAPLCMAAAFLLVTGFKVLRAEFHARQLWIGYAALALGMAQVALIFEKLVRDEAKIVEEVSELAFAGFVFLIVLHFAHRSKPLPTSGAILQAENDSTGPVQKDILPLPSNS